MFSGTSIIFDLDGTLVDTAPDLINALNFVMALEGLGTVPERLIRPQISLGARNMIREGLKFHNVPSAEKADDLFDKFIAHYRDNIAVDSKPFEGMIDALTQLKTQGATLGICTNKTEDMAVQLIGDQGLTSLFAYIAGRDSFEVYKPNPGHLLQTIDKIGGAYDKAIMIGDSATDINTAIAAKIPSIAVTFGYSDVPAQDLGADLLISHYKQLIGAVSTVMKIA